MSIPFRVVSEEPMFSGRRAHLEISGRWAFVALPRSGGDRRPMPWVWYAPTLKGVHPNEKLDFYTRRLLEAGIGFAGMDVGESFGNPAGTRLLEAFHEIVTGEWMLAGQAILLPQSRGGLMLYNWASRHPEDVQRIAGIYPVCDLRSWPGVEKAAGAYGMTEPQFAGELHRYNPVDLLEPLAKAKIPILHVHGDRDALVPIEQHSAELARRYRELGGQIDLIIPPGQGHTVDDTFFKSEPFARFLCDGRR